MSEEDTGPENAELPDIVQANFPVQAPTVYADGLLFATNVSNTIRLQFAEYVPHAMNSSDPGLKTRVVLNVAIPVEGYSAMMKYLNDINITSPQGGDQDAE